MFLFYFIFHFYYYYDVMLRHTKLFGADIFPSRPIGDSPIERRGAVKDMVVRNAKADEEL